MSGVSSTGGIGVASGVDRTEFTGSIQLQFAKLQLALSGTARSQVEGEIEAMSKAQKEQQDVCNFLQEARQLQMNAKADGKAKTMPATMREYMDAHGLAYPNQDGDNKYSKDEWEAIVASFKGRLDTMGTDTQQKMIFVQDYMGQYNAYLQGSNTAIQQANQVLTEVARSR
ncbi:MAG: USH1C-binding protein 1 [Deltaproteobacteria bacterium]|jgi:hypothetical protein|nr:USH1C-binding protein 1 [Deltaproteobacteria bacterium]